MTKQLDTSMVGATLNITFMFVW